MWVLGWLRLWLLCCLFDGGFLVCWVCLGWVDLFLGFGWVWFDDCFGLGFGWSWYSIAFVIVAYVGGFVLRWGGVGFWVCLGFG